MCYNEDTKRYGKVKMIQELREKILKILEIPEYDAEHFTGTIDKLLTLIQEREKKTLLEFYRKVKPALDHYGQLLIHEKFAGYLEYVSIVEELNLEEELKQEDQNQ